MTQVTLVEAGSDFVRMQQEEIAMLVSNRKGLLIAAAAFIAPSAPVAAQEAVTEQANRVAEQAEVLAQETNQLTNTVAEQSQVAEAEQVTAEDRDDDDSGNWGWLGLLGLAGLLGLRRRDEHPDRNVHVDRDRNQGTRL